MQGEGGQGEEEQGGEDAGGRERGESGTVSFCCREVDVPGYT